MIIPKKKLNNFILYFILNTCFLLVLFITFYNLHFFFAYAVEENALFFGQQFNISSNNGTSELPQIAAVGNNVYVVWQDNTTGNYDIFFTYSTDNGSKFAPVRNLSNNNGTSELPQIAAVGNNVYVVWQDNTTGNYDIFFKPSVSNGVKFKSVRSLSNNNGTSELPEIAAVGNNVYVVWQDNTTGNYDIFFKRSPNDGNGFRTANLMNSNGTSELPQIAAVGNNVYVVWQDNTTGNYDILFQPSVSNGVKFKSARNLSNNNGTSELPQIAVSSNDIYVIWRDNDSGMHRIFFKHGQKDNATAMKMFGPINELNHSGDPSQVKIITGSEFFYGVWTTKLSMNNASIIEFYPFLLFEDYLGDSIPLTRLSSNETVLNPDIAVGNNNIYLVWNNINIENGDIFFKKLSTKYFHRNG